MRPLRQSLGKFAEVSLEFSVSAHAASCNPRNFAKGALVPVTWRRLTGQEIYRRIEILRDHRVVRRISPQKRILLTQGFACFLQRNNKVCEAFVNMVEDWTYNQQSRSCTLYAVDKSNNASALPPMNSHIIKCAIQFSGIALTP